MRQDQLDLLDQLDQQGLAVSPVQLVLPDQQAQPEPLDQLALLDQQDLPDTQALLVQQE